MHTPLVGNTQVVAGGPEIVPAVLAHLEEGGIRTQKNPDVYVRAYTHFGIEEARELRERASLRGLGGRRVFVIAAPDMNREAQNALLKTLEESPGDALFIFVVPSPETLLSTVLSRAQMLRIGEKKKRPEIVDVKEFLSALPQRRLDLLKPLLEKGGDDRRDVAGIISFLATLEEVLAKHPEGLKAVYRARAYVNDKGALVKPLLEQVALLAPRV